MQPMRKRQAVLLGVVAMTGGLIWWLNGAPTAIKDTVNSAGDDAPPASVYQAYGFTEWQWVVQDSENAKETEWQASTVTHRVQAASAQTQASNIAWQQQGMAVRANHAHGVGERWQLVGNVIAMNAEGSLHTERLTYAAGVANTTSSVYWQTHHTHKNTNAKGEDGGIRRSMTKAAAATLWLEGEGAGRLHLHGGVHTHIVPSP